MLPSHPLLPLVLYEMLPGCWDCPLRRAGTGICYGKALTTSRLFGSVGFDFFPLPWQKTVSHKQQLMPPAHTTDSLGSEHSHRFGFASLQAEEETSGFFPDVVYGCS